MVNLQALENLNVFRTLLLPILGTLLLALIYVGFMYGWIAITTSADAPSYVIKIPLRQFFVASLFVALIGYFPLKQLCQKHPNYSNFCMVVGALMASVGITGLILGTLIHTSPLPDFGDILEYSNFLGPLFLFFSLTGIIPYVAGFFITQKPRTSLSRAGLFLVTSASLFFISAAIYVLLALFELLPAKIAVGFMFTLVITAILSFLIVKFS